MRGHGEKQETRAENAARKNNTKGTRKNEIQGGKKENQAEKAENHGVCCGNPGGGSSVSAGGAGGVKQVQQGGPGQWMGFGMKLTWPLGRGLLVTIGCGGNEPPKPPSGTPGMPGNQPTKEN